MFKKMYAGQGRIAFHEGVPCIIASQTFMVVYLALFHDSWEAEAIGREEAIGKRSRSFEH